MRKRGKYVRRPVSPPMIVCRGLQQDNLETKERIIVESFALGFADEYHLHAIQDMSNVLSLAAEYKKDDSAKTMCEAMKICILNIMDRHKKTGRYGASGDELNLMREFVGVYSDFWLRQPVKLYEVAVNELQRIIDGK